MRALDTKGAMARFPPVERLTSEKSKAMGKQAVPLVPAVLASNEDMDKGALLEWPLPELRLLAALPIPDDG